MNVLCRTPVFLFAIFLINGCARIEPLEKPLGDRIEQRYSELSERCGLSRLFTNFWGQRLTAVPPTIYKKVNDIRGTLPKNIPTPYFQEYNLSELFWRVSKQKFKGPEIDESKFEQNSISIGLPSEILLLKQGSGIGVEGQDTCDATLQAAAEAKVDIPYLNIKGNSNFEGKRKNQVVIYGGKFLSPIDAYLHISQKQEDRRLIALALLKYYKDQALLPNNDRWYLGEIEAISLNSIQEDDTNSNDVLISTAQYSYAGMGSVNGNVKAHLTKAGNNKGFSNETAFYSTLNWVALPSRDTLIALLDGYRLPAVPVGDEGNKIKISKQVTFKVRAVGVPESICAKDSAVGQWQAERILETGKNANETITLIDAAPYAEETGLPACLFTLTFSPDNSKLQASVPTKQYALQFYLTPSQLNVPGQVKQPKLKVYSNLQTDDTLFPQSPPADCKVTTIDEMTDNVECSISVRFKEGGAIIDTDSFYMEPMKANALSLCGAVVDNGVQPLINKTRQVTPGTFSYTLSFKRNNGMGNTDQCRIEPNARFTTMDQQQIVLSAPVLLNIRQP